MQGLTGKWGKRGGAVGLRAARVEAGGKLSAGLPQHHANSEVGEAGVPQARSTW